MSLYPFHNNACFLCLINYLILCEERNHPYFTKHRVSKTSIIFHVISTSYTTELFTIGECLLFNRSPRKKTGISLQSVHLKYFSGCFPLVFPFVLSRSRKDVLLRSNFRECEAFLFILSFHLSLSFSRPLSHRRNL